ncbi:MAG: histidine phosphatase family protein [Candidatus Woesebacteria bacterium]
MTTFYLIRHGQKQESHYDPELTELGHQQAQKTGEFLKKFPISYIIASPKLRTQQTAGHIAATLSLPIHTDERLKERMDFADYIGKTRDEFFHDWVKASWNRMSAPLHGMSSYATGKRIRSIIEELDSNQDMYIALVTHGGAISDFLRNEFSEDELVHLVQAFPEGRDYSVKECSITTIQKDGDKFTLVDCHNISHL